MAGSFHWEMEGLHQPRFQAYTKLLRVRSGGQVEEVNNFDEFSVSGYDIHDLDDDDTLHPATLCGSGETKVKRAFLDRLSELVANKKGGHYTSASMMIEWPDKVDVLVAKNSGIGETTPTWNFLRGLEANLRKLALMENSDPAAEAIETEIWSALLQMYGSRMRANIRQARLLLLETASIGFSDAEIECDTSPPLALVLQGLLALLNDTTQLSTQEGLIVLVYATDSICRQYSNPDFERIIGNKKTTRSLRYELELIGRLRRSFETLTIAARTLSNFENLHIIPLDAPSNVESCGRGVLRPYRWSAQTLFLSLGLDLDDRTVVSIMGPGSKSHPWTKARLLDEFGKLKSSQHNVHAEVQLALASARHDCTGGRIFEYIGCSKRSCYLCDKFLRAYNSFVTRGCHGKMYDLWNVPGTAGMSQVERTRIAKALLNVEEDMKHQIHNRTNQLEQARESVVGGTTISTVVKVFSNMKIADLAIRQLVADRDANAVHSRPGNSRSRPGDDYLSDDIIEPPPLIESQLAKPPVPVGEPTIGECSVCERATSRPCSLCNLDLFCSQRCQDQMSIWHLRKCCGRQITTADLLENDVMRDVLPEDEQVRDDYGFSRCRSRMEDSHLLGLYGGVFKAFEVSAPQVHAWRQSGELTKRIIELFSERGKSYQGSYYPWFLRNQHLLDESTPPFDWNGRDNPLIQAIEAARPYLSAEDRNKLPGEIQPSAKRDCFLFYAMALNSFHPSPDDELDIWYEAGFATCEEGQLGSMYSMLVGGHKHRKDYCRSLGIPYDSHLPDPATCSFEEFWRAWDTRKLAGLLRAYGLLNDSDIHGPRRQLLSSFLSCPKGLPRPSVWRLKHFLALDRHTSQREFPGMDDAVRQFGFDGSLDAKTQTLLTDFYKRLFGVGDPLRIQEARDCGKLLSYARSLDGRFKVEDEVIQVLQKLGSH
ncbi:hypothetical protein VM1G_11265 [Cytospora mali]|uniref:MYND-type zinc finger protein samB n=1 Tax=Cytospora mali TaxID=578113 RepID=A0A194VN20_CYTMA|nr:hypothetical protein VM1G_11265 [Valsa mali]